MRKFSLFLIIALGFTALLAGYIMFGKAVGDDSGWRTGTILDKFSNRETGDKEQVEEEAGNKPLLLTDRQVTSPANSVNKNSVVYFEKNTGKIFEFDYETGTEEVILNEVVPNSISAIWSPKKREVVSRFYSTLGDGYKYYNLETFKTLNLDKDIRSIAFSPDGEFTVHYHLNIADEPGQSEKIAISQPNGQYPKKILQTRIKDLQLSWPVKDRIALSTGSEIILLTEDGKLTKLLESNFGLEEKWSPSGKKLLFSSYTDMANPEIILKLIDTDSRAGKVLGPSISASRCVWSIDDVNIFCAAPKTSSSDEFYRINTFDGSAVLIAEPEMPVKDLFLSTSEDYIIFINASDDKLYKIKITP